MTTQDIRSIKRSMTLWMLTIFAPPFFVITGLFINDHFKIKDHETHKVDREYFHQKLYEYTLLSERKIQALESLASSNERDISEVKKDIEIIREVNEEINRRINELRVTRGMNPVKIIE